MEKDLISVIVPIYNVEQYLDKCINSIVNQSYKNLEIILVDDGSPDNCPAICDEWAKKDSRIKVIHKPNGGLSDARNFGIEASTGNYLMFIDSDDYVSTSICEKLYNLIIERDADFSMCSVIRFYGDNIDIPKNKEYCITEVSGKDVLEQLNYTQIPLLVIACAKLYKKELFKNLRFVKGKLHEDMFFEHRLLGVTNKFVYCNEPLYFYLTRPQSIMANLKEKNYMHIYDSFVDRFNYLNEVKNYDPNKNKLMFLANIRYLYTITPIKYKDLKKKLLNEYKALYKHVNNKCFKEFAFYHFRWLFLLLLKIRKNK